jgi:hypothetical protein
MTNQWTYIIQNDIDMMKTEEKQNKTNSDYICISKIL